MLEELFVENLGIIAASRIEPGAGLVAVTGETGAGKTLLLGALRLLRGDAAGSDRIGPHGDEARVEGRFSFHGTEAVIARRVTGGTSRAYLDGSMVPAKLLAERLEALVEVVAQNEHLSLGREASVRRLLDAALDDDGKKTAAEYSSAWARLKTLRSDRDALGGDARALARDLELARHEAREVELGRLQPGEDEELHSTLGRARHAGEITQSLGEATMLLDDEGGAADLLRTALDRVRDAAGLDPGLVPLASRIEAAVLEIEDVAAELRAAGESIEHDPEALRGMEDRAAAIADLKRKYGATVEEVLAYGAAAKERAMRLGALAQRAETIDDEIEEALALAVGAGEALAAARARAGSALCDRALELLRRLGFRSPVLSIDVGPVPPGPSGADRVALAFSSDEELRPGPVSKIASGGELSRLVLSVRVAAGVADADVVAFDEIDAGVGGATALAMGELLARLATGRQVLVVTHLPQIAAFADAHFVVDREGSRAVVRRVEGTERLAELARMLSGIEHSARGQGHAEELLALAGTRKQDRPKVTAQGLRAQSQTEEVAVLRSNSRGT
jgi:DNA repair protein RecN (Recombination protein N)